MIDSGRADMRFKMFKFKAQNAGNSESIAKICNAEVGHFGLRAAVHELIRGSLPVRESFSAYHGHAGSGLTRDEIARLPQTTLYGARP